MFQFGELSDEIMDTLNIANNMGANKDGQIIPRRRMTILSKTNFLKKEWEKT